MNAKQYIEKSSKIEEDEFGDTFETISVQEAHTAVKLAQWDAFRELENLSDSDIAFKISNLYKELKFILKK